MFHRVKSEPAPNTQNTPAVAKPAPQANAAPNPAPVQQVSAKEDIKFNENRPTQAVKPEQNNAPAQAAAPAQPASSAQPVQPRNPTPENSKKEDAKTMTEQAKPNAPQENSAPRALEIPGSASYQRPGQPPVRAAGTFPGAYPGYNPNPAAMAASDRRLIIGRGITMSGEIESCDHLIVEGTVEASLKGASVLDIAESGVFYGTVEINEATIAGRFEGDIQVSGRLTIRTGGVIKGSITYKELEVEAGATIDGRLSPIGAESDAKKGNNSSKNRDAAKSKKDSPEAANSDDGLFSKQAAAE